MQSFALSGKKSSNKKVGRFTRPTFSLTRAHKGVKHPCLAKRDRDEGISKGGLPPFA